MGAPITIKKSKMTVKKTARPSIPVESADTVEADESLADTTDPASEDAPVFVSKPVPTGGTAFSGSRHSAAITFAAVIALIATLLLLFVLLLQWTEFSELQFLFPRPLPLGTIVAMLPW